MSQPHQPTLTSDLDEPRNRLNIVLWVTYIFLIVSLGIMKAFAFIAPQSISATDFIFPLVAVLWVIGLLTGKLTLKWHNAYWLFALYFFGMFVSSIFSQNPTNSFGKLIGEGYLIGLAVITFNLVRTEARMRTAILAWLTGTAIAILIGIVTVVLFYVRPDSWLLEHTTSIFGAVPVIPFPRVTSTFISASMFCNYLTVGAALIFILWKKKWIGTAGFIAAFAFIIASSFSTVAVGIGGMFLTIGLCVRYLNNGQAGHLSRLTFAGSLLIAFSFVAVSFVALQHHSSAPYSIFVPFAGIEIFPSPRLMVWSESLTTFRNNFFTGNGLNQPSANVLFQNTDGHFSLLTDAHNTFLSIASQNGITGLVAILAICSYLLNLGLRPSPGSDKILVSGLTIAFASAFVYAGLTGSYEDSRHLWVLTGLLLGASKLGCSTQ